MVSDRLGRGHVLAVASVGQMRVGGLIGHPVELVSESVFAPVAVKHFGDVSVLMHLINYNKQPSQSLFIHSKIQKSVPPQPCLKVRPFLGSSTNSPVRSRTLPQASSCLESSKLPQQSGDRRP